MLDLLRLQMLHGLSVHRTITATAAALGYSASAVSQQLAVLEREVGATLFDRTARSIALTDAGLLLVGHATELLGAAEKAQAELNAQSGRVQGHLTVSVIPNLAAPIAVAVARVQSEHPGLDIVMRETTAEPALAAIAERISDLAITDRWTRQRMQPPQGLTKRTLRADPVGIAVHVDSPAATRPGPLDNRALAEVVAELTWLCAPTGHVSRTAGDDRLTRAHAQPRRRWEFEGLITIAELVTLGVGAAFLPQKVADTQPRDRVRLIALAPSMTRHIEATMRTSSATSPAIRQCLNAIVAELDATGRTG